MDPIEFGKELRKIRNKKGLTLEQLGEKSGFTKSYLSIIENGKQGLPQPKTLERLSKGLNQDYNYLMHLAGYIDNENFQKYEKNQYELLDSAFQHQQKEKEEKEIRAKIEDDLNDRFKDILGDTTSSNDNELIAKYLSLQKDNLPDTNKYYSDFEIEYEDESKKVPYFNLYSLLRNNPNISYKFQPLTESDVQNIMKFIDTFIYKMGK